MLSSPVTPLCFSSSFFIGLTTAVGLGYNDINLILNGLANSELWAVFSRKCFSCSFLNTEIMLSTLITVKMKTDSMVD